MNMELAEKVAIVGGSSRGLGKGCAMTLAMEGAKVTICARNEQRLDQTAQAIRRASGQPVLAVAGDLSKPETVHGICSPMTSSEKVARPSSRSCSLRLRRRG